MAAPRYRLAILISGNGSNLRAIHQAIVAGDLPAVISVVISNVADAGGLAFAKAQGIATTIINHKDYVTRESFDEDIALSLDGFSPDLIVLAGFMRRLSDPFVDKFFGKLINIHPSLLPKYPGLNTHQAVLDHQEKEHGCSIHYVTAQVDAGPIISQQRVAVEQGDTLSSLVEKLHAIEHQLYWRVISLIIRGDIHLEEGKIHYRGAQLPESGLFIPLEH